MIEAHWLEQAEADVPRDNTWLSARELDRLNRIRFAKRCDDWRLGRWTAKCGVAASLNLPTGSESLARIEVRPAASGAPEVLIANMSAAVIISLSHRDGRALCALASPGVELGCDLEIIEPRSHEFVADYFTPEEQARIAQASPTERPRLLALLWSAKESALKALQEGLRLDTRSVSVSSIDMSLVVNGWSTLEVCCVDGRMFRGWWQQTKNMVRTLVANPPTVSPILLSVPAYLPCRA